MIRVPRSMTLVVDSRERYPLLFPANIEWHVDRGLGDKKLIRIKHKVAKLDWGDYLLEGYSANSAVERKGSLDELHQNLYTDDRERFLKAIRRLRENCRHPYLLLDVSPLDLWKPTPRANDPAAVWDALIDVVSMFGLGLLWGANAKLPGARRILGEQVLRILISHALREEKSWQSEPPPV